jgi:hypothetical protein
VITVANKKFKTKKQLECFARDFLTENDGKEIFIGEYGSKFLYDLVSRHPEKNNKIKEPIQKFIIHRNFGGHIALSFVDKEGEKSIGWRKCVNQRINSYKANLREVCRNETKGQIQLYKDMNYHDGIKCGDCSSILLSREHAHVDHKTIPFRDIFESFYKEYFNRLPKEFASAGNHLGYVFMKDDFLMAEIWKEYHRERADYQILCSDCNTRKG